MKVRIKKFIYILLGSLFFILSFIGVILPVIPTTPFLILSFYFYINSSEKLHKKMINSEVYKKYAKDFIENKHMTLKRKIVLLIFASTMLLFPLIILNYWLKIIIILIYLYLYYYFIFKIKTI